MLWVALFIVAASIAVLIAWTMLVVQGDDPGPRPTRDDYDTRRPE
ncbi:hypothetical protein QSU92_13285 [Microbacterium sp. ET2]|nr:hypothetical protein [Microbacterium sp. ET2 (Ac-2212)]WJL94927.1 hypothetical protein QSU92_13285 [Microbacterium sp. ET2 (Ac-2212)]